MKTEEFKNRLEELKQAVLKDFDELVRAYRKRLEVLFERAETNLNVRAELASLDALPWKPYRSGSGEWIFADKAPRLRERLRATPNNTLEFGGYRYRLRANGTFIARYPIGR